MKTFATLITTFLLAACSSPQSESARTMDAPMHAQPAASTTAMPGTGMPIVASASGTVESVDAAAGKITISHGAVEALKWPAMTMTFKAGAADIGSFKPGDHVAFEFTSTGMDGTLTRIAKQ